jgi:deoxyribodipyrimidine photo-lyase
MAAAARAADETAIVWFRRDLRMHDNPALAAAARAQRTVPVFCFEPGLYAGRHRSGNRNAYLRACLEELAVDLERAGAPLLVRDGDPAVELPRLARETGASRVHVNRDHTAHARARDRRVEEALSEAGAELAGHSGLTCAEIATIERGGGGPYRVFSPFHRAWEAAPRRRPAVRPRRLRSVAGLARGRGPSERRMGIDAGAKRIAAAAGPGETAARRRMRQAVSAAADYARLRDVAAADATTRLSPALHLGTISPLELESELRGKRSAGAAALRRQLAWRDFWLNVIRNFPANRRHEHDARFRGMSWRDGEDELEAWKQGRTGVPWVDAGMRQLLAEGWMHNRLRLAVGSYLTKNLLIDWRAGEQHFMEQLLDGDESQNNGNWQWVASVGADPQPYFRVFNPVRQQQRFDPDGDYVRRWVPELRELPDEHLAAPWEASEEVLERAGLRLGRDYPEPLVDLSASRAEAIERFERQRGAA